MSFTITQSTVKLTHYRSRCSYVIVRAVSKATIPRLLKYAVWTHYVGSVFDSNCTVKWCKAPINPFTFEVGHNIPESKGGKTTIENLRPICSQCNKSMGNRYTIDEFTEKFMEDHHN